jgi:hypothetical protein
MSDVQTRELLGEAKRLVEEVAHELEAGNAGRGELALELREAVVLIDNHDQEDSGDV